ncbi:unnamed protein product [Ranitomeya imitator]|uniref:Major facilitator superfamily (MFS) profile domain-containing protein n=1 Tax=Ranitomeya imitator TaxID=111125 RepID=A0ABN9KYN5_9NEOB|nr:unnamed protein product [Ranitomeya imitator]
MLRSCKQERQQSCRDRSLPIVYDESNLAMGPTESQALRNRNPARPERENHLVLSLTCDQLKEFISGLCGALFIVFGAIGALLCGLYVDRTKKFTEVVKISFALTALTVIVFAVVSNLKKVAPLLVVICSLLGFFGFAIYPISMELAVECSYPVGEGSSTGLAFISGQVQGLIYMVLFQSLTKPYAASPLSQCGKNQTEIYDWSIATLVMAGICSIGTCIFIIFFHTDYKRLKAELAAEKEEHEDQLVHE